MFCSGLVRCVSNSPIRHSRIRGMSILAHNIDRYGGIVIDDSKLPSTAEQFELDLKASLADWVANKRRGLWLKIPTAKSRLIPVAIENGFTFHHAHSEHAMLTKWIPEGVEENKLPHFATTHLGVGGIVINEMKEVLLIQERYFLQHKAMWKIPGGSIDLGEDISTAAIREVFEETGIRTEFVELLAFRHLHGYNFGRGDIYFVCSLRPIGSQVPNPDPAEISACRWMPATEYAQLTDLVPLQREIAKIAVDLTEGNYKGFAEAKVRVWNSQKTSSVFLSADHKLSSSM
ncbi:mitochondrial Nudix hydrolase (Nudix_Hydrolase_12) [Andalucia godoyi]|uniref:Nucleoside diphosphate-linked moiety X motif 6 n=1 Tax=Andalucia godoyi TaxID=505711 RepID=A0A8K0AJE1_ANDGO|nr:mitochondrial Nudix hydrolase (Nudix_Hydrolase_12) [Andalucia godoyi]|eukprot:ANDGO_08595.mRNA.1 mitochondrial Nudix hydrolase (Nudix_Hydrolase_12)